jgi:phage/plasmid-associated DNA primase
LGSSKAVDAATAEYRSETDVTERFFKEMCVFGDEYMVTRKALFDAWEKWALEEGEEPGKQNSFTRLVSERSKSLNVRDGYTQNGRRCWRGVALKSDSPFGPEEKVTVPESPANQQKTEENCHFSEKSTEVQSLPPSYGPSEKIDEKVSVQQKVSVEPRTFEVDGLTIQYMEGDV